MLVTYLKYSRKDSAKRVLEHLDKDVDYIVFHTTVEKSMKGRPKELILLTMNAAQRFSFMSKTEIGKQTARTVARLIECLADYDILVSHLNARNHRHDTIVELYKNYPVVYLADVIVCTAGSVEILKKIGWSNNLESRQETLQTDMKTTCVFTHAFKCIRSLSLEQEILKNPLVKDRLFKEEINGHKSTETLVLDSDFTESHLIDLINECLPKYNICSEEHEMEVQKHEIALQKVKLESRNAENLTKKMKMVEHYMHTGMSREAAEESIDKDEHLLQILPGGAIPMSIFERNCRKNSRGYKIQRINPDDPTVAVETYESPIDVTREVIGSSKSRVINAIKEHTLYMGSRWWTVPHDKDERVVHDLPPTKIIKRSTKRLIAKLDKESKMIKEVFASQREAMKEAQLSSPGAISMAIKNDTLSHGHKYKLWEDCSPELRAKYIEVNGNPEVPLPSGIKVQRLHPLTKQPIETYANIEYIVKHFQVARDTLKKAIANDRLLKGWFWRYIEEPSERKKDAKNSNG